MEEEYAARRLALVLAIQADIEAMKIENIVRESNGESPAYGENAFFVKAEELRGLAYVHNMQLFG